MAQIDDWEKNPHMLENLADHIPYLMTGGFTGWRSPENQAIELKRYPVQMLVFENPNSGIYRMAYTKVGDTLFVTGDVGEAAYRWPGANPDKVDLEWISNCDLGYFHSKCVASEVGRDFVEWNEQRAKKNLEMQLREMYELEFDDLAMNREEDEDSAPEYPDEYLATKTKIEELGGYDALYNRDEWNMWMAVNGYDVFDERQRDMYGLGTMTHLRCLYHLLGLKLAFKRLNAKKTLKILDDVEESGDD